MLTSPLLYNKNSAMKRAFSEINKNNTLLNKNKEDDDENEGDDEDQ